MTESKSSFLSDLDRARHVHSFTDLSQYKSQNAAVICRGEGIYLFDADGVEYLDAMASLWCVNLGYSEKRLMQAAFEQMSLLPKCHTFRGRSNDKLISLAERLIDITPDHLAKVYFAGSGSEANESAIKIAWSYHKQRGESRRRKIISRLNGYHGSTIFASQLSGMSAMQQHLNTGNSDVLYADSPDYATYGLPGESESEFADRLMRQLENLILENGADTIAAFIAEPVMAVGGLIIPPEGYFEKIQSVLERYGILMIIDEVVCGFGRTGNLFGSQTFNIVPDIMTIAKGITSAYFPMSAVTMTGSVFDALVEMSSQSGIFSHGFTYSGHPVGAAIALESINILEERNIIGHVRTVSKVFNSELVKLQELPCVANTRSVGLMAGFDLVAGKSNGRRFDFRPNAGSQLVDIAVRHGLFIRAVGNTIVMAPPLIITESEILELNRRLRSSLLEFLENASPAE